MTLAQHFAAYSEWRSKLSSILDSFGRWLTENELADAQIDRRVALMLEKLREDRLHVAFVAEFSRGKSELINAIFFADYGSRILPSTAGRTTMCPTELMFDQNKAPSIELLPIETRQSSAGIGEYKRFPEEWTTVPLDTASAEAMQDAFRHVSDVRRVDSATAEKLGFPLLDNDETTAFKIDRAIRRGGNTLFASAPDQPRRAHRPMSDSSSDFWKQARQTGVIDHPRGLQAPRMTCGE